MPFWKGTDSAIHVSQGKERANAQLTPMSIALCTPALAPWWHTATLVGLMLAVFVAGTLLGSGPEPESLLSGSRLTSLYLPMLAVQWGLALYVVRIGRQRSFLRDLLGTGRPGQAAVDIASAAGAFALILASETFVHASFGTANNAARGALLPSSPAEHAVWVVVAVSVGVCEELVYRGYLLRQLRAFCHSLVAGCVLSALLFGLAHAEQGAGPAFRFGLYALLLSALAVWRRSLVPGILAHIALDLGAAFL
jgi:membrane protease YdiL (CAAX protease family)